VDAGNCYKKSDAQEAINCLMKAIEIYTDMGRFTIAAKHHMTVAEIYESECVDIEKAIIHFEQAADYFKGEESNTSANRCLLNVARYSAQLENYQKVIYSFLINLFLLYLKRNKFLSGGYFDSQLLINLRKSVLVRLLKFLS